MTLPNVTSAALISIPPPVFGTLDSARQVFGHTGGCLCGFDRAISDLSVQVDFTELHCKSGPERPALTKVASKDHGSSVLP
jgi:hypothetical protein